MPDKRPNPYTRGTRRPALINRNQRKQLEALGYSVEPAEKAQERRQGTKKPKTGGN